MKKFAAYFALAAVALIAGGFIYKNVVSTPETQPQPELKMDERENAESIGNNSANSEVIEGTSADAATAQRLTELRAASAEALARVEAAMDRLDELELQVELIETQIREIEWRGDDPADNPEEVLPYLRPVLAEYLDAEAALNEALEAQRAADAALASALAN